MQWKEMTYILISLDAVKALAGYLGVLIPLGSPSLCGEDRQRDKSQQQDPPACAGDTPDCQALSLVYSF